MKTSPSKEEAVLFSVPQVELPADWMEVVRWVSTGEAEVWESNPHFVPPQGRELIPVTKPGMPKPAGTGQLRLEFGLPRGVLMPREQLGWFHIKSPSSVVQSIVNLRIVGPRHFPNREP